jgi:hypothetical protein
MGSDVIDSVKDLYDDAEVEQIFDERLLVSVNREVWAEFVKTVEGI